MERLRDNSWVFGLGAAALSFPITIFALESRFGGHRIGTGVSDMTWIAAVCGSLGMLVACRSAYASTRQSGLFAERVMLLTGLSFGMAFLIAALPFGLIFPPLGLAFAWMGGATVVGPPILVFIILWSALYTLACGPGRAVHEARSIVHAADPAFSRLAAWSLLSAMTLAAALCLKL